MKKFIKKLCKKYLSNKNYLFLANRTRDFSNNISSISARFFAKFILILPDRFIVLFSEELIINRLLDWHNEKLYIEIGSLDELDLRMHSCSKEPETIQWLSDTLTNSSVFFDIGANVGAYSLIASSINRKASIFAFEPGANTFSTLVKNVRKNNLSERITCIPFAMSSRNAISKFSYSSFKSGSARHPGLLESSVDLYDFIFAYKLDDLIETFGIPQPTHLKIDVDGSELFVIEGAKKTLKKNDLTEIMIEINPNESNLDEIKNIINAYGFILHQKYMRGDGVTANYRFCRS